MISNVDLHKEIKHYEALTKDEVKISDEQYKKAMIKLAALNLKLLHNIRTNMTRVMEKLGVEKVQPKAREDEKSK
jgi:hypothetical protein